MRYVILALVRADAISAPARARAPRRAARLPVGRHAFTLIEMLVSLAITLIMMGAVVTLFGTVTDSVSSSRALLEASDRLRACRNRLQADLQCATASMKPPLRPENGEGYLEIIEGPNIDGVNQFNQVRASTPAPQPANTLFGDTDDALLLTVRSRGEPFVGKIPTGTLESQVAEVAYFLARSTPPGEAVIDPIATDPITVTTPLRLFTLYRRVMLVYPAAPGLGSDATNAFYNSYDVSARYDATLGARVANTLGDLTKRENRFNRGSAVFPFPYNAAITGFDAATTPVRLGDDVILTNVLSFDVQVYDPGAPLFVTNGTLVEPRDAGYRQQLAAISGSYPPPLTPGAPIGFGAYVDLGYGYVQSTDLGPNYTVSFPLTYAPTPATAGYLTPLFASAPPSLSGLASSHSAGPFVYDTWSWHYENDGVDQFGDSKIDLGTNGLDDDGINGVDDIGERETMPPYPSPLRGIRVTIRVYEPSSQQVRQVTVVQDYLPD
jgi:prepilin-type N-terminal cleavage/methylation domain-containing protein